MANTIALAWGTDKSGRVEETSRPGDEKAEVQAATWNTRVRAHVLKDGSGSVTIYRKGEVMHHYEFGPEVKGE